MTVPGLNVTAIPNELRSRAQWVCHNADKEPLQTNGRFAKSNNPRTWTTFQKALTASDRFAGIGFVPSPDDPFVGIDIDNCIREDGSIAPDAWAIIKAIDSYTEFSPSGGGVHIWARADGLALNGNLKRDVPELGFKKLEVYRSGQYLTVTGNHLDGTPATINERSVEVGELYARFAKNNDNDTGDGNVQRKQDVEASLTDIIERARKYVAKMEIAVSGQRGHDRCFAVAMVLIEGFALSIEQARPIMESYSRRCEPPWSKREIDHKLKDADKTADPAKRGHLLRSHISSGNGSQRADPDLEQKLGHAQVDVARPPYMSATELATREIAPLKWTVSGLLPEGQAILAGRPKAGKSRVALQIATDVALGRKTLEWFDTIRGDVLLIALEDSEARLQRRLEVALDGASVPENLIFTTEFPMLGTAGLAELDRWINEHPAARLIIIDTLPKIAPPKSKDQDAYDHAYQLVSALQKIAIAHHVTILCVLHTRKSKDDDIFATVMGSTGWTASADSILVLTRERGKGGKGQLHLTGRDVEEAAYELQDNRGLWAVMSEMNESSETKAQKAVKWLAEYLSTGPRESGEIFIEGKLAGFGRDALYEAKKILGVRARRPGGIVGPYWWSLPPTMHNDPEAQETRHNNSKHVFPPVNQEASVSDRASDHPEAENINNNDGPLRVSCFTGDVSTSDEEGMPVDDRLAF